MPEQPYFEVQTHCHGQADQSAGEVPAWCDLTMKIKNLSTGATEVLFLTRSAGEAVIDALHETLHPWQGGSIIDLMYRRLDDVVQNLLDGTAEPDDKVRARAMAEMISILVNPYRPNIDAVRDQSVERVRSRTQAK